MGTIAGRLLYAAWGLVWGGATTIVHALLYMVAFGTRRLDWALWVDRSFARCLLGGLLVRLEVEGRENIPAGRSFVAMSNHQSYLDIPALFLSLRPATVVFVAKRELGRIPFLGWAIAASHHIMVDRGNREQAVIALQEAIRRISSGVALGVFAEGTRSPDLRLLPFKKGGFYVAVDSGLPIVPVSLSGSGRLFGKRTKLPRRGTIRVRIHPPVTPGPGGRAEIPRLREIVRAAVLSGVPEAQGAPDGQGMAEAQGVRTEARIAKVLTVAMTIGLAALVSASMMLTASTVGAEDNGRTLNPAQASDGPFPWEALDRAVDALAKAAGIPADRLRVDPAAIELEDSYTGRLRLERYLLAEPRRAPATLNALAEGVLSVHGAAPRLDLLSRLAWTRSIVPRPLDIRVVRLPTDTLRNPVESAMERLYAGTGKRFQGSDRDHVVQESSRLPVVIQGQLAGLMDALVRANRMRDAVAKSSDLKQGGAFDTKSKKTAARLREFLTRWGEPELESDETMSRMVYSLGTVNLDVLYVAGVELAAALDEAADGLSAGIPPVGEVQFEWPTPLGRIAVGGDGVNTYRGSFALVLDTGGADVYQGPGGTSGQEGASLVIDLSGDDRYEPADSAEAGPGGAILGYAGIVDVTGKDTYVGTAWSGGFGFLGVGWIHDRAGDDVYLMQWQSQGCGLFGLGLLADDGGDDEYRLADSERGFPLGQGQGFGGPFGLGVLIDGSGNDAYWSTAEGSPAPWGGEEPVPPGSLVQGASLGAGVRWAGGFGFLVDGGGSDQYEAPGFAQGFAWGAGLGVLADRAGDDGYTALESAMGSGRGLGVGLLLEGAGDDGYAAGMGSLGAGEDLGLGILAEGGGDDRYEIAGSPRPADSGPACFMASAYRQGAGWLLEGGGEDLYPPVFMQVDPGATEPWRAPVPGVVVWIDLEQSLAGLPRGMPLAGESSGLIGDWQPVDWQGPGPGVGGGWIRIAPGDSLTGGSDH